MPRIALSKLSIEVLQAEIQRRAAKAQKKLNKLLRQRAKLDTQIAELEVQAGSPVTAPAAMAKPGRTLGPKPAAAKVTRATGRPLGQYVAEALNAAPNGLSVKAIEVAVRKLGYPTTAKSLYTPIIKVVTKGGFQKVEAGVYAMKGSKAIPAAPATKIAALKAPKAKMKKRGKFSETGEQLVLGLLKGKGRTTSELTKAWKSAGRGGKVDNSLGKLVATGKIQRAKLKGKLGSIYTLV